MKSAVAEGLPSVERAMASWRGRAQQLRPLVRRPPEPGEDSPRARARVAASPPARACAAPDARRAAAASAAKSEGGSSAGAEIVASEPLSARLALVGAHARMAHASAHARALGAANGTIGASDVLRAVPLWTVLASFSRVFSATAYATDAQLDRLHASSESAEWIDFFISHAWLSARWGKAVALAHRFQLGPTLALALVVSIIACALTSLGALPTFGARSVFHDVRVPVPLSFWCSLLTVTALLGGPRAQLCAQRGLARARLRRPPMLFVDRACINQTDAARKRAGVGAIGRFLRVSRGFVILWDEHYFQRLWCIFELAAFYRRLLAEAEAARTAEPRVPRAARRLRLEIRPIALAQVEVVWVGVAVLAPTIIHVTLILSEGVSSATVAYMAAFCAGAPLFASAALMRKHSESIAALDRQLARFCASDAKCASLRDRRLIFSMIDEWYSNGGEEDEPMGATCYASGGELSTSRPDARLDAAPPLSPPTRASSADGAVSARGSARAASGGRGRSSSGARLRVVATAERRMGGAHCAQSGAKSTADGAARVDATPPAGESLDERRAGQVHHLAHLSFSALRAGASVRPVQSGGSLLSRPPPPSAAEGMSVFEREVRTSIRALVRRELGRRSNEAPLVLTAKLAALFTAMQLDYLAARAQLPEGAFGGRRAKAIDLACYACYLYSIAFAAFAVCTAILQAPLAPPELALSTQRPASRVGVQLQLQRLRVHLRDLGVAVLSIAGAGGAYIGLYTIFYWPSLSRPLSTAFVVGATAVLVMGTLPGARRGVLRCVGAPLGAAQRLHELCAGRAPNQGAASGPGDRSTSGGHERRRDEHAALSDAASCSPLAGAVV